MKGNDSNRPEAPKSARMVFGIIMILVYLAVGLLFIFQVFNIIDPVVNYVVGGLLIIYGIYRGYRLYKGGY